ncbi:ActS/PrrB/RegB family redox-sensitive histidine kinase [Paracoccaceae bacterium]|nr:ActS/PrrB/RegB family redox-sensitive histidine kinase [Paracoccaceae bacterium]
MINLLKRQIYLNESWIKPRTLLNLRWLAIAGQVVAIAVTEFILNFTFNVEACLIVIFFSCLINLTSSAYFRTEKRLSAVKTFAFLAFDLTQISLLLFFSGGISNPFSILIIVPTIVSASSLPIIYLIILGVMTLLSISFLSVKYFPIIDSSGDILKSPEILLFGFSASLIITVTFLGSYVRKIFLDNSKMNRALQATQVALERERKLTALTGVVAALGHELGSPLATIKLASSELLNEINSDSPIYQDIRLIYDQIERCKAIISDMGSLGKDDQYVKTTDFFTLLFEAIQPYKKLDKKITFRLNGERQGHGGISIKEKEIPLVRREPELIHGIRNIIHNAIKFAKTSVDINLICNPRELKIEIVDDGMGLPHDISKMIGEPFIKESNFHSTEEKTKTHLEGMGLGLFIANILLEKTNGQLKFSNVNRVENNGKKRIIGAKVEILWERSSIEILQLDKRAKLKENPRNVS